MHPVLQLPLLGSVQSHDAMVVLAAVVAASLGFYWAVSVAGLSPWRASAALALVAAASFIGGRAHFVFTQWAQFGSAYGRALRLSSSALHAPGAILGAAIGSVLTLRFLKVPALKFADALAPAVGIGIALARIGCFLHGCCYGLSCSLPWGVTLPDDSYVYLRQLEEGVLPQGASRSLPVHPLPLYFAAAGIGIATFLLWLRPRKRYDGQLALVLLVLFAASSAILEPLRADDSTRIYWGPLPQLLWVSAAMAAMSVALLAVAELVNLRKRSAP